MSVNDTASMAGLLEIIVILWRSIHRSLESNKEARAYTISKFASVLPEYLKVFKVSLAALISTVLWDDSRVIFSGSLAACPLSKSESSGFPPRTCTSTMAVGQFCSTRKEISSVQ